MEAREMFVSLLHIIGIAMIFFMIDYAGEQRIFTVKNKKNVIIYLIAIIIAISIIRVK